MTDLSDIDTEIIEKLRNELAEAVKIADVLRNRAREADERKDRLRIALDVLTGVAKPVDTTKDKIERILMGLEPLTLEEIIKEFTDRDWLSKTNRPGEAIRIALKRAVDAGEISLSAPGGRYQRTNQDHVR